jgi:DNA-binding response OmpR family regulator
MPVERKPMKSILIIDDESPVREVLKIALKENGYDVREAEDGRRGIDSFSEANPDIVITDVNMPEMSGIAVTQKIREMNSDVDIVIMTGYGSEELVIEALRAGASNYIKKPISFKELFTILDGIYLKRQNKKRYEVLKDVLLEEMKTIAIDNDIRKVWGTVNQVFFNAATRLGERELDGIKLGLYEIIVNAIEHGNLGITYEEKEDALNRNVYQNLLEVRLRKAREEKRTVNIKSVLDRAGVVIEVRDEGKGFDYSKLPTATDAESIMSAHGRGVLLASLYFDSIEFQSPGNAVVLRKAFPS